MQPGPATQANKPVALGLRNKLELKNVCFCFFKREENGVPGEKPPGARRKPATKLNLHMTSGPGIEPWPHWWEARALTTAPSLFPSQEQLGVCLEQRYTLHVNVYSKEASPLFY